MNLRLLVSFLLAILAFLFIVQNATLVQVRFLFWTVELSHVLLMALMLGSGFFLGWVLNSFRRHRKR